VNASVSSNHAEFGHLDAPARDDYGHGTRPAYCAARTASTRTTFDRAAGQSP
jgi:hypothetical protein